MPATPWSPLPPPHRPYQGGRGQYQVRRERGVGSRAQIGLCLPMSSACAKMRRGVKQCWKWRRRPLRAVEISPWKRLTVFTSCQRFVYANVEILILCFHHPYSILSILVLHSFLSLCSLLVHSFLITYRSLLTSSSLLQASTLPHPFVTKFFILLRYFLASSSLFLRSFLPLSTLLHFFSGLPSLLFFFGLSSSFTSS